MRLKDRIQLRINMVEYLRETKCSMQHFTQKFSVTTNIFYQLRVIANDNQKFEELKARLEQPRRKYNQLRVQCNSNEVQEWLKVGIKEMLNRGKSSKEISKIFNRKINDIEMLIGEIDV